MTKNKIAIYIIACCIKVPTVTLGCIEDIIPIPKTYVQHISIYVNLENIWTSRMTGTRKKHEHT